MTATDTHDTKGSTLLRVSCRRRVNVTRGPPFGRVTVAPPPCANACIRTDTRISPCTHRAFARAIALPSALTRSPRNCAHGPSVGPRSKRGKGRASSVFLPRPPPFSPRCWSVGLPNLISGCGYCVEQEADSKVESVLYSCEHPVRSKGLPKQLMLLCK